MVAVPHTQPVHIPGKPHTQILHPISILQYPKQSVEKLTEINRQRKHFSLRREAAKPASLKNGKEAQAAIGGDGRSHEHQYDHDFEIGPLEFTLDIRPSEGTEDGESGGEDADEDEACGLHVEGGLAEEDCRRCDGGEA